jgi:hypothetical protein
MDDKDYCVSSKTCGKCRYYSRNGTHSGIPMCNYYLITGQHRNEHEPVSRCNVRKRGERLVVPSEWESDLCRPKREALNA